MIRSPAELYDEIVKVAKPEEIGNWMSDLECKVTDATTAVVNQYKYRRQVMIFHSMIDGTLWYDIPFAFTPWRNDPKKYT